MSTKQIFNAPPHTAAPDRPLEKGWSGCGGLKTAKVNAFAE
jgi:hypothetical protein